MVLQRGTYATVGLGPDGHISCLRIFRPSGSQLAKASTAGVPPLGFPLPSSLPVVSSRVDFIGFEVGSPSPTEYYSIIELFDGLKFFPLSAPCGFRYEFSSLGRPNKKPIRVSTMDFGLNIQKLEALIVAVTSQVTAIQ